MPNGAFSGNPGSSTDLATSIRKCIDAQALAKLNIVRRAWAPTFVDMGAVYDTVIAPFSMPAMTGNLHRIGGDMKALEAATVLGMSFPAISRADGILNLDIEELLHTGKV